MIIPKKGLAEIFLHKATFFLFVGLHYTWENFKVR